MLGPIFVVKVPFTPKELAHKLVAELWLYPDGGRIFELSTKCAPPELMDIYTSVRHYLVERGIDRHGEQQTKTSARSSSSRSACRTDHGSAVRRLSMR